METEVAKKTCRDCGKEMSGRGYYRCGKCEYKYRKKWRGEDYGAIKAQHEEAMPVRYLGRKEIKELGKIYKPPLGRQKPAYTTWD